MTFYDRLTLRLLRRPVESTIRACTSVISSGLAPMSARIVCLSKAVIFSGMASFPRQTAAITVRNFSGSRAAPPTSHTLRAYPRPGGGREAPIRFAGCRVEYFRQVGWTADVRPKA